MPAGVVRNTSARRVDGPLTHGPRALAKPLQRRVRADCAPRVGLCRAGLLCQGHGRGKEDAVGFGLGVTLARTTLIWQCGAPARMAPFESPVDTAELPEHEYPTFSHVIRQALARLGADGIEGPSCRSRCIADVRFAIPKSISFRQASGKKVLTSAKLACLMSNRASVSDHQHNLQHLQARQQQRPKKNARARAHMTPGGQVEERIRGR